MGHMHQEWLPDLHGLRHSKQVRALPQTATHPATARGGVNGQGATASNTRPRHELLARAWHVQQPADSQRYGYEYTPCGANQAHGRKIWFDEFCQLPSR